MQAKNPFYFYFLFTVRLPVNPPAKDRWSVKTVTRHYQTVAGLAPATHDPKGEAAGLEGWRLLNLEIFEKSLVKFF